MPWGLGILILYFSIPSLCLLRLLLVCLYSGNRRLLVFTCLSLQFCGRILPSLTDPNRISVYSAYLLGLNGDFQAAYTWNQKRHLIILLKGISLTVFTTENACWMHPLFSSLMSWIWIKPPSSTSEVMLIGAFTSFGLTFISFFTLQQE